MNIKELNEFMRDHGFCNTNNEDDLPKKYVCDLVESALKEGRNKAIDEFAERIKQCDVIEYMGSYVSYEEIASFIDEIAEQMKGGATDE